MIVIALKYQVNFKRKVPLLKVHKFQLESSAPLCIRVQGVGFSVYNSCTNLLLSTSDNIILNLRGSCIEYSCVYRLLQSVYASRCWYTIYNEMPHHNPMI